MEDIQLNGRVFQWPKDMEVVIDLASQRLALKRDQAETVLRNKVVQFDIKLVKHKKQLNQFKKKDPPLLTIEEMTECVETVEALVDRLKVIFF